MWNSVTRDVSREGYPWPLARDVKKELRTMTPTDWPMLQLNSGRLIPFIAGGNGNGDDDPPPDPKKGKDDEDRTFTQAEVNRIAAREKEQGRQAAISQLQEDLGLTPEEAKKVIDDHRKREDAEKSDAQLAKEAADREKAEAEEEKRQTRVERHEAKVERRLLRAGVPDDDEGEKLARVLRMVTVEPGASDDDIQADVDKLKEQFPQLFEKQDGGGKGRAPSGDPPGTPPKPKGSEDAYSRGAERAKTRFGRKTEKV